MRGAPGRWLAVRLREMVGAQEDPARLAAAWAVGIGLGLSPLLGFHALIALLVAVVFRLNKVDALLGTLVINPWTLAVYFPAATVVGSWITGVKVPRIAIPPLRTFLDAGVWREQASWLRPLLVAWAAGAAVIATVVGVVTFFALRELIAHHRRRHAARAQAAKGPE